MTHRSEVDDLAVRIHAELPLPVRVDGRHPDTSAEAGGDGDRVGKDSLARLVDVAGGVVLVVAGGVDVGAAVRLHRDVHDGVVGDLRVVHR